MTRQWHQTTGPLDRVFVQTWSLPALPPPRLTADVYELPDGHAYVVEMPVPGLTPDQITIEATSDTLTVSTQPRQTGDDASRTYLQREQAVGPMARVIEFPEEIDTDNIRATLELGILKIEVPKAAAARRRIIKVTSAR